MKKPHASETCGSKDDSRSGFARSDCVNSEMKPAERDRSLRSLRFRFLILGQLQSKPGVGIGRTSQQACSAALMQLPLFFNTQNAAKLTERFEALAG